MTIDPYASYLVIGTSALQHDRGNGPREMLRDGRKPDERQGAAGARTVPGAYLVGEIDRCAICSGSGICEPCSGSGFIENEPCDACEGGRGDCFSCDGMG